ncbi:hypothetical protein ABEO75_27905, partial [Paenibacillus macerans]|uniref:hypothetical protein n=1 Tax=Paenibacillus macerans TaxID=44252 RepID=UPI003D26BFD8
PILIAVHLHVSGEQLPVDFHVRSPLNQEFTHMCSLLLIIPNVRSLIKLKISPETASFFSFPLFLLFFFCSFFLNAYLSPQPLPPERKG